MRITSKTMNDIDLINRLKNYIEEMNINAAELARKLETNPANVSYWFNDKCKSLSSPNKAFNILSKHK